MSLENIVNRLVNTGERKIATELLEALNRSSYQFEEFDDLAKSAFKIKEIKLAIKYALLAIEKSINYEQKYVTKSNLINLYNIANFPEKALELIEELKIKNINFSNLNINKAFALYSLNDKISAEKILRKELKRTDLTQDEQTRLLFNLGTYELLKDNLLYGLELFLLEGRRLGFWKIPKVSGEEWIGQPIKDKTLFVFAEGGIGDELINIRFLKHLEEKQIKSIWYSDRKDLVRIFKDNGFNATDKKNDYNESMLYTTSMTLPLYLELTYETLWQGPYIKANKKYVDKFSWIKEKSNFKIGLRWQGNPEYEQDLHRSILLKDIIAALPPDQNYFSLQKDTGLDELKKFPDIIDLSKNLETFEDTLGVIENLDIVITSCTSIAHASAAMGKRTFVFVPISSYYVWCHSTKQSPWYGDNVIILRQLHARCWKEPIKELEYHLKSILQ